MTPVLGAGIASCPWWLIALLVALTIFLSGAEPAMRRLDIGSGARALADNVTG